MALKFEKPSSELMDELLEVRERAGAFAACITTANALPKDFPLNGLLDICEGLANLANGTAEGALNPLEYARSRLPAVRRQFLQGTSKIHPAGPEPERGSNLDDKLGLLIASIATALDQYRALAVQDSPRMDVTDYAVGSSGVEKVSEVIRDSEHLSEKFRQIDHQANAAMPSSDASDNFSRTLEDAKTVNDCARAETRMESIVVRWLRTLAQSLRNYPEIIRRSGDLIQDAADMGSIIFRRWSEFRDDALESLFKQVRDVGAAFHDIANQLDEKRARGPTEANAALNKEINLTHNFGGWLRQFLQRRDPRRSGVLVSLVSAEVTQRTNLAAKAFAKSMGYRTFGAMLQGCEDIHIDSAGANARVYNYAKEDIQKMRAEGVSKIAGIFSSKEEVVLDTVLSYIKQYNESNVGCLLSDGSLSPMEFFSTTFSYDIKGNNVIYNVKSKRGIYEGKNRER